MTGNGVIARNGVTKQSRFLGISVEMRYNFDVWNFAKTQRGKMAKGLKGDLNEGVFGWEIEMWKLKILIF